MPKNKIGLVWFKNDLRLHDNETLVRANEECSKILCVYIVDPRNFERTSLGFRKLDINRFVFLEQTVKNLQHNLELIGGKLLIQTGEPEKLLPKIIDSYKVNAVYFEEEYASEELQVISRTLRHVDSSVAWNSIWGKTLYHKDDIPFTIDKIPLTSKAYRIPTTKQTDVRTCLTAPTVLHSLDVIIAEFPHFGDFAFAKAEYDNAAPYMVGGESSGLERLKSYSFETELLTGYRWTRNRSLGMDYSSKFSPYLALGSLSPRKIYEVVKLYEQQVKKNQSTWWIIFEVVWRDFFTFKGMRMGNAIFKTEGYRNKDLNFTNDKELFSRWCDGLTGIPFIDAHMRQLNATGYMSNRGRVNCASFLVHDYHIDWTWGAAYFESKLIDYDVSANWMNWHVQAYEIWYTNPVNQQLKYKAKEYIQKWIPELSHIHTNAIYIPWHEEVQPLQVNGYPKPAEVFSKWSRAINLIIKSLATE